MIGPHVHMGPIKTCPEVANWRDVLLRFLVTSSLAAGTSHHHRCHQNRSNHYHCQQNHNSNTKSPVETVSYDYDGNHNCQSCNFNNFPQQSPEAAKPLLVKV